MIKVAINGFGRIGRNAFKIAFEKKDIEVVAINDLTDNATLAYLLQHDTIFGTYDREVTFDDKHLIVGKKKIVILSEKDPTELPWDKLAVDVVIESTGRFVKGEDARMHLTAGANKVVISAPAKSDDVPTYVLGVNDDQMKPSDTIISNASCTTNCMMPVTRVIQEHFGIQNAMMTTIHSYTSESNVLVDSPGGKDLRTNRAGAENIIPTTTGASSAAAKTMPELEGAFEGLSIRVPTPDVSLCDTTYITKKTVTAEQVNAALKNETNNPALNGILAVSNADLVSSDFVGNPYSAIVDLKLTRVVGGNMLKVVAWYDNEWGYSNRLVEIVEKLGKLK